MAIIKADLEGAVRIIELSADDLTVDHVRRHLGEMFDKPMLDGFELHYVADDDEMVLIDSDEEFLAGLCENGSPFRLSIVPPSHDMQSLASCGLSLLEETENIVNDAEAVQPTTPHSAASAPVPVEESKKVIVGGDEGDGDEDDESVDEDDQDDDSDDDGDQRIKHFTPVFATDGLLPSSQSEGEAVDEAHSTPTVELTRDTEETKQQTTEPQQEQEQDAGAANVFVLAAARLRARSRDLANLQVEQLQRFMEILQFDLSKLIKCRVLAPTEIGGNATTNKRDKSKTKLNKKHIEMPASCIQVLRDNGLVASDEEIHALVNTIRVQPKRFKKLGLVASQSPAAAPEDREWGRRSHGSHGNHARRRGLGPGPGPGRGRGKCGARGHHTPRHEFLPSEAEWIESLPENHDILFEQAALRTHIELSAHDLRVFMQLLRLPLDQLREAGLLSEMEMRGDGTGSDKLISHPPLGNAVLAKRMEYHASRLSQKLQEHDLVLDSAVVQRLMELLRVLPSWFLHAGIVDAETWRQEREARRADHKQSFSGWVAHMMGMATGDAHHFHHDHDDHDDHHDHHGHRHAHSHQQHLATTAFPTGCPTTIPSRTTGTKPSPPLSAREATPVPTPSTCAMNARPMHPRGGEMGRRFPTNASMANIVPVDGRQSGKVVSSGVRFEQRWKVQNDHSHCWPAVVEIIPDNEDAVTLGVRDPVVMSLRVQPKQSVDIAIVMDAPTAPGLYRPRFRLRDGQTALAFGQRLANEVLVVDPTRAQQHEPQLPPRMHHTGMRRRVRHHLGGADY